MKREPPNETTTAGAHIGIAIWRVKRPAQAKALLGLPTAVTFVCEEDRGSNSSSAEEAVEEEERGSVLRLLIGRC